METVGTKWTSKKPNKEAILDAKINKTFIAPSGREYMFNYRKEGRKYIFIITYEGTPMQIPESDYNKLSIDQIIDIMEKGLKIK